MKYRKKPVVIEAIQFTLAQDTDYMYSVWGDDFRNVAFSDGKTLTIQTLEGAHTAGIGDYIIKGVKGEFYPCKPDIFGMTYERADE